jgi:hypothetical protein
MVRTRCWGDRLLRSPGLSADPVAACALAATLEVTPRADSRAPPRPRPRHRLARHPSFSYVRHSIARPLSISYL